MADCHSGLQPVQGLGLLIPELVLKLLKDLTHLMVSWPGWRIFYGSFLNIFDVHRDRWTKKRMKRLKQEETRLYK